MDDAQDEITFYYDKANRKVSNKRSEEETQQEKLKLCTLSRSFDNITILEITKCDMGKIPNSIQHLNLKQLLLSHNKLPEVPTFLYSGLSCLETLDLSFNSIRDFDTQPACHNSLKTLNIANNRIKNFPYWILMMSCENLEVVWYSNNFLRKLAWNRAVCLRVLEMRNCGAIDVDFPCLKSLKNLEKLDLGNEITTRNENSFKELKDLFLYNKWKGLLHLSLNNLTLAVLPKELFSVVSLQELCLIKCDLNWIPDEISGLKNLRVLDVSENRISSLPASLTGLAKLEIVRAAFNHISLIDEFNHDLEILDVFHNLLEDFQSTASIKYLDLERNLFDTVDCDYFQSYKMKRDDFRKEFNLNRETGPTEIQVEEDEDSEERDLTDDESYISERIPSTETPDSSEENWTDFYASLKQHFKHPDVTPSDEEWNADVDMRKTLKNTKKQYFLYDENEDVVFVDADEE